MATKILWFSRHKMTDEMIHALGLTNPEIRHIDKPIRHASEISNDIKWADIIAVIGTVELKQEFLELAESKPVLTSKMERYFCGRYNVMGERIYSYSFQKWVRISKIHVETTDYIPSPNGNAYKIMPAEREVKLKYFAKKQARQMIDEMMTIIQKNLKDGCYLNKDYFLRKYAQKIDSWGASKTE